MTTSPPSPPLPSAGAVPPPVAAALEDFQVVRNVWLRRLLRFYPVLLAVILLLDLFLFRGRLLLLDLTRLTSYLSVAVAAMFFVQLYDRVPATLRALWDRRVLFTDGTPARPEVYAGFIQASERSLNHRAAWLAGGVALAIGAAVVWYGDPPQLDQLDIWIRVGLSSLSYFMDGVALWRLLAVGYMVMRLAREFELVVQPAHPDKSGGLQPLGDLCFANARVLLGPVVFIAGMLIALQSPELLTAYPTLNEQAAPYAPLFQRGIIQGVLLLLLLAELVAFFLPLYDIHQDMLLQRQRHHQRLDALTRRMSAINQELLELPQGLEAGEAQKRLDQLKWMRQVYEENRRCPTWPFDRDIALKLTTSQVVPLLSLTGLGKPLLDLVGSVVNFLQQQ
jgi:hypothetical protein